MILARGLEEAGGFVRSSKLKPKRNNLQGLVCLRWPVVVNHVRWNSQLRYLGGPPDNQVG